MALTILDRPQGCKLDATANTSYSISSNGYGDAILTGGTGLADGDKIYIYQSFTSYNGFWYVVGHGPGTFRLRRYEGSDYLAYTQDHDNVTIYACIGDVDYSCVHLPIVYTLQSGKWPTNNEDTIRNIVGFANDNGNVRITLDGSIDVDALDWLKISNTSEDELDGPFQIITKHSPTQFTIDSPYSLAQGSPYTYASATAQKYYNNYMVNVRVYGGLRPEHQWASLKPYELIATLSLPPGSDNLVKVNVAEMLKEKMSIQSNRPNYDSMPYDLDRFTGFYIAYAEQYDDSNGTDVETFTSSYQSDYDFFQGFAVDAELTFKNRFSGFLSDYVYLNPDVGKFLSDGIPSMFEGYYFDMSWISTEELSTYTTNSMVVLTRRQFDANGNETVVKTSIGEVRDNGVQRQVIVPSSALYELIRIGGYNYQFNPTGWVNGHYLTTTDPYDLITNTGGTTTFEASGLANTDIVAAYNQIANEFHVHGITLDIRVLVVASNLTGNFFLSLEAKNQAGVSIGNVSEAITSNGIKNLSLVTTGIPYAVELSVLGNGTGAAMATLTVATDTQGAFTEEKRINVEAGCVNQYIYLTWKNPLGGFNYWLFTSNKDYSQNIIETQEREKNIYPQWPHSFGEHQDTVNQETYRSSAPGILVRAENLTQAQVEFIKGIKLSSLVQQMTTKYDRRTMIVDTGSFRVRTDAEGLHNLEFTIRDTANNPSPGL